MHSVEFRVLYSGRSLGRHGSSCWALMMAKTVAYLMIVVLGYKYLVPMFSAKNLLGFSYMFVVMRLFVGVFYRKFTKFYGFTAETYLGKLHVHTLVLGSC